MISPKKGFEEPYYKVHVLREVLKRKMDQSYERIEQATTVLRVMGQQTMAAFPHWPNEYPHQIKGK